MGTSSLFSLESELDRSCFDIPPACRKVRKCRNPNTSEIKMGVVESHFADIIWANEPLHSRDLVKLCEKELNWNRSTTYTVLRKLCERGIFQNNGGTVSSVLTKNEFYAVQSEQFVDETFEGSLPAFIAAFTQRKGISQQEAAEIRHMIDAAAGKE